VIYDVEMTTIDASQAIRDAYGLFWRKKSGRRLPNSLKGISFSNATTYPTRVRIRMLKELCRKHQLANPALSCYVTSYLARPELKIRDRRGLVTSLTYSEAVQQLSQHLSLNFLQELYKYARANLPENEVIKRFLVLTPDLLLGAQPEQVPMSVDDPPPQQQPPQASPETVSDTEPTPQGSVSFTQQPQQTSAESLVSSQQFTLPGSAPLLPSSGIAYASIASLPPSSSSAIFSLAPASSSGHTSSAPEVSSPTYATLTPLQVSPPQFQTPSGSFLATIPTSGTEPAPGDDFSLVQRHRHRFAQKSAPYPAPT
jgi:hypothetical protein